MKPLQTTLSNGGISHVTTQEAWHARGDGRTVGRRSARIGAVFGGVGTGNASSTSVPTNQSPPTITGTTEVGSTLTATTGTWNGTTPITYTYQWRRCDTDGGSCSNISGANRRRTR